MRSVGVRALQQNAAAILRDVRRGERVQVTDRGRPVAWLVSPAGEDVFASLEAAGLLQRSEGDLLELGPPISPRRRRKPASQRLAEMRMHER